MGFEPVRAQGLPPLPKVSQIAMLVDDKNYSQVDLYGQIILRSLPDDPHGNLACAWVAKQFGLFNNCRFHINKAKRADRSLSDLSTDLHIQPDCFDEATLPDSERFDVRETSQPAFHLMKAWGFGFGSEMAGLMGQAYLAEILHRQPIVHWGENFLYREKGNHCVFQHFFKPFNPLTIKDISNVSNHDIFPPKWNQQNLVKENIQKREGPYSKLSALYYFQRKEQLTVSDYYSGVINIRPLLLQDHPLLKMDFDQTYRYLVNKYLQVRDDIIAEAESFIKEKISSPYIAVHARGSDKDEGYKALTSIPRKTLDYAKSKLSEMPAKAKLFLMTDDVNLLNIYQQEFGDRVISTDSQRSSSELGVHYDSSRDKTAAGIEVLIDMLIAAKSNCFIGLGLSNPSQLICYFGHFDPEDYILFGENRLKQFNTHLYKTIAVL